MKVTRLKKGYRINLSDAEFNLLSNEMRNEALGSPTFYNEDWGHLPLNQQRVCAEINDGTRDWFAINEDRRSS